jgi:Ca2+-binding RTX toxin-like protein
MTDPVKYAIEQAPGVKEGNEAFGKLRGAIEDALSDSASTRSPEATKAINDAYGKIKDAEDAFNNAVEAGKHLESGVDKKGMRGLADLADAAGYLGDAIGGLLGGPAGKMAEQAANLLHLAGDALNWFAENVLEPIVDALTLPDGIRPFIPSLRDPLILDLDGLGVSLTPLSGSPAHFDFTGSGFATQTGWVGAGDGMLITAPLDGSTVKAENVLGALSGNAFADLKALDTNDDGVIDAGDNGFANLRVWVDNGDASSNAGELHTLSELGITSISLSHTLVNQTINGNTVVSSATFTRLIDGQSHTNTISEVDFATNTQATKFVRPPGFAFSESAMALPELIGYGHLPDLWAAMTLNQDLLNSVKSIVLNSATMNATDFDQAFENILFRWAGVDDIDPASRGPYIDARHLEFVLAFYGVDQTLNPEYAINPQSSAAVNTWEPLYQDIVKMFETRFITQITFGQLQNGVDFDDIMSNPFSIFDSIRYDRSTDRLAIDVDVLASDTFAFIHSNAANESVIWAKILPIFADLGINWNQGSALGDVVGSAGVPVAQRTIFQLGAGDDSLFAASDQGSTVVYSKGDGDDTLHLTGSSPTNTGLAFMDLVPTDVVFRYSGLDLLIMVPAGDTITIANQLASPTKGIDHVAFADGSKWSIDRILANLTVSVPQSNGQTVSGSSAVDVFLSGSGADVLQGGGASDIYLWAHGAGDDVINETSSNGALDRLALIGVTPAQVTLVRNGGDVTLVIAETGTGTGDGGSILLKNSLDEYSDRGIEKISFADGTVWTRDTVRKALMEQASTSGNDVIDGFNVDDVINAGAGNDTINAGAGNDAIAGETGDDTIFSGAGNDTIYYSRGNGNDTITEVTNDGTDRLKLVDINSGDVVLGYQGSDLIVTIKESSPGAGDGGSVRLVGSLGASYYGGVETIVFADGTVWGPTEWTRILLTGTSADETFVGFASNDTYYYSRGGGNDTITEFTNNGTDQLKLVNINPADVRLSYQGSDLIVTIKESSPGAGDAGSIKLVGSLGASYYAGVETIAFADGTVWGPTDWTRVLLTSTSADESFVGFASDDTYYYSRGGGNDTITETSNKGTDQLKLVDINPADVRLSYQGSDLIVTIKESSPGAGDGGSVRLGGSLGASYYAGVETIAFADGTVWGPSEWTRVLLTSTSADETFVGFASNDTYYYSRGGGNDTIIETSNRGTDQLKLVDINPSEVRLSNQGSDLIVTINESSPGAGDGGSVRLVGSIGASYSAGVETIVFADGTVWGPTEWTRILLTSTSANEAFVGFASNDTYYYSRGGGNDTITETSNKGADQLKLVDINPAEVTLQRNGNHVVILIAESYPGAGDGGSVVLFNSINSSYSTGVERLVFADGTTWDSAAILAHITSVGGTPGSETISGTSAADEVHAGRGNDTLTGGAGGDTYIYLAGDGNDIVDEQTSGSDSDTLRLDDLLRSDVRFERTGSAANDAIIRVLSTGETITLRNQFNLAGGVESIVFKDGEVLGGAAGALDTALKGLVAIYGTAGNDTLVGTSDGDTFIGGTGDDRYNSGAGSDIYLYAKGDGSDYIDDQSSSTVDVDVLRFSDLNATDVTFSRSGVHTLITVNETGAVITLDEQLASTTAYWGLERIQFADGTIWDRTQIQGASWIRGTAGNDTLTGTTGNDTLSGSTGNDTINGAAGNDTLYGDAGNDTLNGGDGNDAHFGGDGDDLLIGNAGVDSFDGGNGIDTLDFTYYTAASHTIDLAAGLVTFSDATPAEQVLNIENVVGGAGVNDIRGSVADNRLDGGAGNDAISGNDGNDILIGGAGNDTLTGGSGDDAFVFRAGFGKDTVTDFVAGAGSLDVLDIVTDLFADFASVLASATQVGADTVITHDVNTSITLKNVALTSLHHDDFRFTTAA